MKVAISSLPQSPWWGEGIISYEDNPFMKKAHAIAGMDGILGAFGAKATGMFPMLKKIYGFVVGMPSTRMAYYGLLTWYYFETE